MLTSVISSIIMWEHKRQVWLISLPETRRMSTSAMAILYYYTPTEGERLS